MNWNHVQHSCNGEFLRELSKDNNQQCENLIRVLLKYCTEKARQGYTKATIKGDLNGQPIKELVASSNWYHVRQHLMTRNIYCEVQTNWLGKPYIQIIW